MKIIEYHIEMDSIDEMLKKEVSIIEKLDHFKGIHPGFTYTVTKEFVSNTLIVKQMSMDHESIN